jgi:hypothetical protein
MSQDQRFFDPIELPGRKPLVTHRDAAQYITKLPKDESALPQWGNRDRVPDAGRRARRRSDVPAYRGDEGAAPQGAEGGTGTTPEARQGLQGRSAIPHGISDTWPSRRE